MLDELRTIVTHNLSKKNVTESEILWSRDLYYNSAYIEKLKKSLFCTIKTAVDDFIDRRNQLFDDELIHEVYLHWKEVKKASQVYMEREELLSCVKQYLLTESDQPLVIIGERGSGKTATISKIVHDVNVAVHNNDLNMKTAIIFRYIGMTQNTETAEQLLYSLSHQLCQVMGKYRHEIPRDYKALKLFFLDLVQRGEFGGMLIILLDSLEKISTCENGHKLEWLPSRIAQNVKIIVTADTGDKGMIQRLMHKCEDNTLTIFPLSAIECENIMKVLMNTSKLSVTYEQWRAIRDAFQITKTPLFITLTLQQVKHWRSYDSAAVVTLGNTVNEAIEKVFDRVERAHGSLLVTHILGYLAASKGGLSESELLDILSLDEIVLNDIFKNFHPNVRRFPVSFLVQIRQDLDGYLEEKETDGILILQWRFSDFSTVAAKRYMSNEYLKKFLHSTIADYYMGKWRGSFQKPYYDPVRKTELQACRLLPEQPMVFGTCDVDERQNVRKMSQLPHSLLHSKRHDDLRSEVFCNFDYLYNRIRATSLQVLLTDFDMFGDRECQLVADALHMSGSATVFDLNSMAVELIGRLLPHTETYRHIKKLVHQCDLTVQKFCPLVPNCQCYSVPGGPLQYEGDVGGSDYCPVDVGVHKSPDGILLTAKPFYSTRVRVWELSSGDPRPDIMMPIGEVYPSRSGNFLNVFQDNKSVKIFRSDCGELHGEVEYGYGIPSHVEISDKYLAFTVEKGCGPYVIELEKSHILHKFGYHSNAVAIDSNETHLACNSETKVILFKLPLMERLCVAEASCVPKDIIFLNRRLACYVFTKSKTVEAISFDTVNRKCKVNKIMTDLEIRECILSNTEKYFMIRSGRCLHLIDTKSDVVCRKLTNLPAGLFVDPISTFSGAGFSADDSLVVASRCNFLAIWDTETGVPLRVLQSSASSVKRLFTSDIIMKVVSLLEDNTFQVWNLENIDTTILHSNNIFPCKVEKVAISVKGNRTVAFSDCSAEAKIISLGDGMVTDILQYSYEPEDRLTDVKISRDGRFVVTSVKKTDDFGQDGEYFGVLTDDVLWDVDLGERTFRSPRSRFSAISSQCNMAMFIQCDHFEESCWSNNTYSIITVSLPEGRDRVLDFPQRTEFVGAPRILTQNTIDYLVGIVQTDRMTVDQETNLELARWTEIRLFVKILSGSKTEESFIRIQNIIDGAEADSQFLETFPTHDERLILLYGRGIEKFEFESSKGLVIPPVVSKGAIVFDVEREECLFHIPGILRAESSLESLLVSSKRAVLLDSDMNLFFGDSYRNVNFIDTSFSPGNFRLALDGKYIAGLSSNKREVIVVRASDGKNVGHVFVHGVATCMELGEDDRTVVVGCEDGRIMILTLILDVSDPYRDIMSTFPSRNTITNGTQNGDNTDNLIREDVRQMECRTPDLARMSARRRSRSRSASGRRTPDHQTISTAMLLARRNSQTRSEACVIQ